MGSMRTFSGIASLLALTLPAAAAQAAPYQTPPACCALPTPGPGVGPPERIPGKAFSDRGDRDAAGAPTTQQTVLWDGTGGTADGHRFAGAVGGLPEQEVDALSSPFDALFAEVVSNQAALLFSVAGEPEVWLEDVTGAGATWAGAAQIDAMNPVRDVDALEIWGPEGPDPAFDDATRYSLEGDPGPVGAARIAVWEYDPGLNTTSFVYTVAQIGTAIGLDDSFWEQLDVDALLSADEQILFSVAPVTSPDSGTTLLDGGEIFVWDGVGAASFLSHGGHLWDTAFDVRGRFDLASENVNALEALAVPEPGAAVLLAGAFAALVAMMLRRRRTVVRLAPLAVALVVAAPAPAYETGAQTSRAVLAGYADLLAAIDALPETARGALAAPVESSEAQYRMFNQCTAMARLEDFVAAAELARENGIANAAEGLRNQGWTLRLAILATLPPSPCSDPALDRMPQVAILESDDLRFAARFELGLPHLETRSGEGQVWTRLRLPGASPRFEMPEGGPAVPWVHRLLAIPQGATPRLTVKTVPGRRFMTNLWPLQGQAAMGDRLTPDDFPNEFPPDEVFDDPPFALDRSLYETDGEIPPGPPCKLEVIGETRGLRVASLSCAVGTYNPVSDVLELFQALEVEVAFEGDGNGFQGDGRYAAAFENATGVSGDSVLNRDAVARHPGNPPVLVPTCLGEELLIVTHEDLRSEADALAAHKQSRGIITNVLEWNTTLPGTASNAVEIAEFLGERYAECTVRPAYLLLFGDAEYVPTWYWPNPLGSAAVIASDYPYAFLWDDPEPDLLMDFAVGRLSVDPEHAQAVVDKIVGYEAAPPEFGGDASSPFFYDTVALASQFECCAISDENHTFPDGTDQRAFVPVVEEVRDHLTTLGFGVERIYKETVDFAYMGDPTPLYFWWGDPLKAALLPPYPWAGTGVDILNAFDAGRFLFIHLDHGSAYGWSHPSFSKLAAAGLTNGNELPFVLSYNCSSGYFDNETDGAPNDPDNDYTFGYESWVESIIRNPDGGAIGAVAGTRTTFGHGNIMIKGTVDAAFPGLDPFFGASLPRRRLGDMFNSGRNYMIDQYGWSSDTLRHLLLYNLHGDPTVRMWVEKPVQLPEPPVLVDQRPEFLDVFFEIEGAVITAWQEGAEGPIPVGRGVVSDGVARLDYVVAPDAAIPLQLAAGGEGLIGAPLAMASVAAGASCSGPGAGVASFVAIPLLGLGLASARRRLRGR